MRRAVLLAHPAGHSASPAMHDAAFAALGIDARYEAWDVAPGDLPAAVARLRDRDVLGANVTVPHKRSVMDLLDRLDDDAVAIGAVNVIRRDDDRLTGANSDAEGFLRSLRDAHVDPAGLRVALLGAGGAARAAAWALLNAGVGELRIANRTRATAESLVTDLAPYTGAARVRVVDDPRDGDGPIDLWLNATSIGMRRDGVDSDATPVARAALEVDLADADRSHAPVAVDLVYRPRRTRFLRDAEAAGLRTVDGAGMLLHQGAVAFEAWTGRRAPLEAMRRALDDALADEARR